MFLLQSPSLDPKVQDSVFLTLVLSGLVFGHTGSTGKELEANITLDQSLELLGVVSKHIRVVCPVVVPQT